MTEREHTKT